MRTAVILSSILLITLVIMKKEACNISSGWRDRLPIGRKIKMIISSDCGIDDAGALILALSHKKVKVLAITTTFGIVEREKVTVNVNRVLRLVKKKVPIFAGATKPMKEKPLFNYKDHGEDGLGESKDVDPKPEPSDREAAVVGKNASDVIFNLVQKNPGCIIVCIGPLTDLAQSLLDHPTLKRHENLKRVYILGGNIPTTTTNPYRAPANFFRDADAAKTVISELERPITLIVSGAYGHGTSTSDDFEDKYMNTDTEKGNFIKGVRDFWKDDDPHMFFDEVAMSVAIDRSIIKENNTDDGLITVDLDGARDRRGKIIFDEDVGKKKENIEYVSAVKREKIEEMLLDSLKDKN